jgi:apolipoprotein D and lipocalin family protein
MKLSKKWLALSAILGLILIYGLPSTASSKSKKLNAEKNVDLVKYSGKWYEIARLPNWFERNCASDVTAEYELLEGNQIRVKNSCKKTNGKVEVALGTATTATDPEVTLRVTFAPKAVRFLPFVWANYTVVSLDENYKHVLIGEPSRKYLWILSRETPMPRETYNKLLDVAKNEGFNISKLITLDGVIQN